MDITSSTSIQTAMLSWAASAGLFIGATIAGLLTFFMGFAVAKGGLKAVMKRLHIL